MSRKGTKAESVTSIAFAPVSCDVEENGNAILALGLESGGIELWTVPTSDFDTKRGQILLSLPSSYVHISSVSKIAWRPLRGDADKTKLTLASCSLDRGCRIFEVGI